MGPIQLIIFIGHLQLGGLVIKCESTHGHQKDTRTKQIGLFSNYINFPRFNISHILLGEGFRNHQLYDHPTRIHIILTLMMIKIFM